MNPYDEIPYQTHVFPQTHPDRLAAHALLRGLDPAPPESCRVLELGCNDGANIVSIAAVSPEVEAVGVDLAERPVAAGNALAAELGVRNVRLVVGDASRPDPSWGTFDYVIAHGVYSWVAAPVRDGLLATIRQLLRRSGVAYVSYATYPGAYVRTMFREMMLLYAKDARTDEDRVRRSVELLKAQALARSKGERPWETWLLGEIEGRLQRPPGSLRHDDLSDVNEPFWFHQFVHHAETHGLKYLGEADWTDNVDNEFPPELRSALASIEDRIAREQVRDLMKVRRFRQTLLVHADLDPKPVRTDGLERLFVAAQVTLDPAAPPLGRKETESFSSRHGGKVTTDLRVGRAAMHLLAERWPCRTPHAEVVAEACARVAAACGGALPPGEGAAEACEFLAALRDVGLGEFHATAPPCAAAPGPRPEASPLARRMRARGTSVVSLIQWTVRVEDARSSLLLSLLDGTRDRSEILDAMRRAEEPPHEPAPGMPPLTAELLELALKSLADNGLLVA